MSIDTIDWDEFIYEESLKCKNDLSEWDMLLGDARDLKMEIIMTKLTYEAGDDKLTSLLDKKNDLFERILAAKKKREEITNKV